MIPGWCSGRSDGWAALVDRWLDPQFKAVSSVCAANRGNAGTHCQGSLSDGRFKEKVVYILGLDFPSCTWNSCYYMQHLASAFVKLIPDIFCVAGA